MVKRLSRGIQVLRMGSSFWIITKLFIFKREAEGSVSRMYAVKDNRSDEVISGKEIYAGEKYMPAKKTYTAFRN